MTKQHEGRTDFYSGRYARFGSELAAKLRREVYGSTAVVEIAARWHAARVRHAAALEREEGAEAFEQRQRYYATAGELARSRRLSRLLYVAEKPKARPSTSASRPRSVVTRLP
jgi:hypothetical protein